MKIDATATFRATDGTVFDDAEQCRRHNHVTKINRRFQRYMSRLVRISALSFKTADGFFLDREVKFGFNSDFYVVRQRFGEPPVVRRVALYLSHIQKIDVCKDGNDAKITIDVPLEGEQTFRISELYAEKKNAERARLELLAETIKYLQEQLDEEVKK